MEKRKRLYKESEGREHSASDMTGERRIKGGKEDKRYKKKIFKSNLQASSKKEEREGKTRRAHDFSAQKGEET